MGSAPKSANPKPFRFGLKFFAICAFLLVICMGTAWVVFSSLSARQLDAKVNELRKAGYVLELALLAPPDLLDEENGAVAYEEAFVVLGSDFFELKSFIDLDLGAPVSEEDRAVWEELVESYGEGFALLEEAAEYKRCRYPIVYEDGFYANLDHVSKITQCAAALSARALYEAAEGRPDAAFRSLRGSIAIAESVRDEPLLISQFLRTVALGGSLYALEPLLLEADLSDAALRDLRDRLDPEGVHDGSNLAFRGELAFGYLIFEDTFGGEDSPGSAAGEFPWIWSSFVMRPILQRDVVFYLETLSRIVDLAEPPLYEARPALDAIKREIDEMSTWSHPFTSLVMPAPTRGFDMFAETEARLLMARLAIDLELQRRATGSLPEALEEPPVDPRTGNPIKFDPVRGILSGGSGLQWDLRKK